MFGRGKERPQQESDKTRQDAITKWNALRAQDEANDIERYQQTVDRIVKTGSSDTSKDPYDPCVWKEEPAPTY